MALNAGAAAAQADRATAAPTHARPVVVKLGGEVLGAPLLAEVAADLARAAGRAGGAQARMLVVHGGGPQATALSQRLGIAPHIVGGRRVTDAATLEVIKMVVAGQLNVDLVAALRAAGLAAVGLHGASGLVRATRRPPRMVSGGGPDPIDFGAVGDVEGFDLRLLATLAEAGYLPVIAGVGISPAGEVLNINADVVASQLAAAVGALALVAVTGVGGVRLDAADPATRIPRLTVADARAAIADGTVRGGMIPKLEEAFAPLAAGVGAVHVVGPREIAASLAAPGSVGTLLLP
ncbi:MAG TPA: acetylglutamate kinase [Polyangia bacterium]|nr:acetylglutamate kinase [Polyangia bacterium]